MRPQSTPLRAGLTPEHAQEILIAALSAAAEATIGVLAEAVADAFCLQASSDHSSGAGDSL